MKKLAYIPLILLFTLFGACENEPIGKANASEVIQVNSELYNLIVQAAGKDFENEITCIDFNYAFTLIIYDENMDIFGYRVIHSDGEFGAFLGTLEEGQSISLSYPITSVLDNGQPFVINNNEELKAAIDKCVDFDTMTSCNTILTQSKCIWKIEPQNDSNNEYEGAYFEVSYRGNVALNVQETALGGTWVTYFIEDELHLNIFLTGDENIVEDWNFDWKIVTFSESLMEITNGTDTYRLIRECYDPCKSFLFEECELEPGSQTAIFDLESYFDCFFPLSGISDRASVAVSYFETYEDMSQGTNPILNLLYENNINPQVIFIRFDDVNTGELVTYLPIILKAINC